MNNRFKLRSSIPVVFSHFVSSRWLSWAFLVAGLLVTIFQHQIVIDEVYQRSQVSFDAQVQEIIVQLDRRMNAYRFALNGASSLFAKDGFVERKHFHDYVERLRLEQDLRGAQTVGFSKYFLPREKAKYLASTRKEMSTKYPIYPEGERQEYVVIHFAERIHRIRPLAIGYDMFTEPVRRAAMEQARDLNQAVISGKVKLRFEPDVDQQAGFLMYFPIYRNGLPSATLQERRANIVGWVYAAFRVEDLLSGMLGEHQSSGLALSIYDGENPSKDALMTRPTSTDQTTSALFEHSQLVEVAGRPWLIKVSSLPAFEAQVDTGKGNLVMIAGILISVLLFFLIRQLAKGRAHAVVLANDMTKELRESEQRWKSALEAAGDGLWGWNLQTGAVFFSSRLAEMFGYAHDEISGGIEDAWEKRIHPDDYDRVMAEKREIEEGKMVTCYNEHRLPCKNGDWKWVLVRGMVLEYTPDGKPARLIGTMTDITNRKINEDRIKRLTHLYAALSHCNQAIVRCVSEETLFSEVCRIAVEFGGMKMAWIGTLSEGNRTFEVIASYGISEEYLTGVQLYVDPDTHTVAGPAREVIHGNSAIWCQDYLNGPFNIPSKERALKFGWRAMAALPLRRDGVVAGLFSLYASEVNGFDQESRALLEELVSNISHAIDNLAHEAARKSAEIEISDSRARLAELSIKLIKAQEEERKNLARELHDELGQRLTALNMGWHSIRASLNGRESEERWTQTCDQLSSLIGLVRTISGSLRPPMLDYLGLEESLRQLLRQQFFNTEIQYVFEYVGLPQKLSAQIEITVYRLVQEGVTNILRHAEANQVTVELNGGEHGDELEIIIRDNGKGVELTQQDGKPQRSGFGLAGMRERAMLLGGKFKFQSAFAHGTRIEVQLPLK